MNELTQMFSSQWAGLLIGLVIFGGIIAARRRKRNNQGGGSSGSDGGYSGGPSTPTKAVPLTKKLKLLWDTDAWWVMSVAWHKGLPAAGEYRLGGPCGIFWNGKVVSVPAKEAIYDLESDGRTLAGSCEKLNYVVDGVSGAQASGGHLYMVTASRKLQMAGGKWASVSADKFPAKGDKSKIQFKIHDPDIPAVKLASGGRHYTRFLEEMDGLGLIGSFRYDTEEGGVYKSGNLSSWSWDPIFKKDKFRPMKMQVVGKQGVMTISKYQNGARVGAGVVRLYKEGDQLKYKVLHYDNSRGGGFAVAVHPLNPNWIYYSSIDWKGKTPGLLWSNQSGEWEVIYATDGPGMILDIEFGPRLTLLLGVQESGQGKLYEMGDPQGDIEEAPLDNPTAGRTKMPGNIRYKVESEKDRSLVIMTPSDMPKLAVVMGAGTDQEKIGRYDGRYHDGRHIYRFTHPGHWWKSPCPIDVGPNKWFIEDTAWDSRFGYDYP